MTFAPTTELVAVGWLKLVPGAPAAVGTELPGPDSSGVAPWAADGAITVLAVGGGRHMYVALRSPIVTVDCWAAPATPSRHPPFGLANQLAETVIAHTYSDGGKEEIDVPLAGYNDARVLSAWPVSEPRRIPEEGTGYAHYSFDLALHWIEVAAA